MIKKASIAITFILFVLINTATVFALPINTPCDPTDDNPGCDSNLFCKPAKTGNEDQGSCELKLAEKAPCNPIDNITNNGCNTGLFCKPAKTGNKDQGSCEKGSSIQGFFGKIKPPPPIREFLKNDPTGAGGISQFLSNLISLFFTLAMIVLVLMIIWGAFDWLISEGEKEKIAGAQKKIINAIIGIILFAIAFAIIRVLGQFTGFTFFKGQNYMVTTRDTQGNPTVIECLKKDKLGATVYITNLAGKDLDVLCTNP